MKDLPQTTAQYPPIKDLEYRLQLERDQDLLLLVLWTPAFKKSAGFKIEDKELKENGVQYIFDLIDRVTPMMEKRIMLMNDNDA